MKYLVNLCIVVLAVTICHGLEYPTTGYSFENTPELTHKPTETTPVYPINPVEPVRPRNKIHAAVQTKHTIKYVDVHVPRPYVEPQVIEIDANPLPIIMHFKSASSRIRFSQSHKHSGAGEVIETKSEDEPNYLKHVVVRPIIQDVREVVLPMRRVVQEIRPVVEEIKTIVSKKADEKSGGISGSASFKGNDDDKKGGSSGGSIGSTGLATPATVKRSVDYMPRTYYQRYY